MSGWTRREFLGLPVGFAAAAALGGCRGDDTAGTTTSSTAPDDTIPPIDFGEPVGGYPFGLGVASGDPDDRSVVLWTWVDRMPERELVVEVAADEAFEAIVQRATLGPSADTGMTARVLATGLSSGRTYWYRFAMDGHLTPVARTRTAPAPGVVPGEPLTMAQLSCMRRSSGYWTALDDVAAVAPDVVVHCGDYIYEDEIGDVRPESVAPPTTLEEYRAVWRRYKADPSLQAAHAVAPWLVVWDDHEVENNYQGNAAGDPPYDETFLDQRTAAYRAWWEHTPTRVEPPDGPNLRIHRHVDWGGLTRFVLLDTRQYRDDQPCDEDLGPRCDATATITMLGDEQEAWFDEVAPGHEAIWTTVVQQVVVHQWRFLGGNVVWNLDAWDGYTGARDHLLATLASSPAPVVLSADVHSSWVADLLTDFEDEGSDPVGAEFVAPGVSSGVPDQLRGAGSLVQLSSPHIAWTETRRRGWVLHTVGDEEWTAEYRLVDDVTVPDAAVQTVETFRVRADRRGLA